MRLMWTSALALSAAFGWGQALAQTGAGTEADTIDLGEIVVTTQKRAQNVRDVPINLTAYTGEFLDRLGVQKFDEASNFVPGFQVLEQSPNNPAIVIRGITSDAGDANLEPRVAMFQDGVSISRTRGAYVELFDIERLEVAKGPQATLFGRGALIGGVNVIQNKADPSDLAAGFEAQLGEFSTRSFRGFVNAPVVDDTLGLRLAGAYRARDGYTTNLTDDSDLGAIEAGAVRASLRYQPTSRFTLDLIGNYQKDDNSGTAFKSGTFAPAGGTTSPFTDAALNSFGGNPPLGVKRTVESVTAIGEYQFSDALSLTSISGYRFFDSNETFDPDGSRFPIITFGEEAKAQQYSQELRLNFDAGDRVSGFFGASFVREEASTRVPLTFREDQTLALLTGATTFYNAGFVTAGSLVQGFAGASGIPLSTAQSNAIAANLRDHSEYYLQTSETESIDLFGELTAKVTSKFEVSAGLRWTQDDKTAGYGANVVGANRSVLGTLVAATQVTGPLQGQLIGAAQVPNAALIPASPGFPVPAFGIFAQPTTNGRVESRSETFDDVTWRIVGRYEFSPDLNVYASYARGRRPEVIDFREPVVPGDPVGFAEVPAETVDSVEFGSKARLLDGALFLDGSVFYYKYNDFQTTEFRGPRIVTVNAGEASSYGFEGQFIWSLTSQIELFGNYAYNRGRFDSGAREGNRFRSSPDHKFAVGGFFTVPVFDESALRFSPTYTWQSKTFFDDDNDQADLQSQRLSPFFSDTNVDELQDAYGLLNARLTFLPGDAPLEIGLFVTNALDEEYIIDAGNTGDGFGIPTFIRGAPRVAGVEMRASF